MTIDQRLGGSQTDQDVIEMLHEKNMEAYQENLDEITEAYSTNKENIQNMFMGASGALMTINQDIRESESSEEIAEQVEIGYKALKGFNDDFDRLKGSIPTDEWMSKEKRIAYEATREVQQNIKQMYESALNGADQELNFGELDSEYQILIDRELR